MDIMTPEAIVSLEGTIYPEAMQQMQACEDWEDIADYCEVESEEDLLVLGVPGKWYALIARQGNEVEFVDIAARHCIPPIFKMMREVKDFVGDLPVYCDARDCTSWKLLRALARRAGIECTVEDTYDWSGETMHRVRIDL